MPRSWIELRFGRKGSIGRSIHNGANLKIRDPQRSTYIAGEPGMGKSTLMLNLILQDISLDDKGIVVLDPHDELVKEVILRCPPEHASRVVFFDPLLQEDNPMGLNVFEWEERREINRKAEAILETVKHMWYGGFSGAPLLQMTLNTIVRTLLLAYPKYQSNFYHMYQLLRGGVAGDQWRQVLSECVPDHYVMSGVWQDWEDARQRNVDIQSSRNKIITVLSDPLIQNILCQPTTAAPFKFQEFLGNRGILLVNLKGLGGDDPIRLCSSLIMSQLLATAFLREEEGDKTPVHVYCDEFYYAPGKIFETLIDQTRKYKIYCTIAHQSLTQLNNSVPRRAATTCGNKIVFRVNPIDANFLAKYVSGDRVPDSGLSELKQFEAVVKLVKNRTTEQDHIKTYPEQRERNEAVAEQIRQQSLEYGRPRAEVESYIREMAQGSPDDDEFDDYEQYGTYD